MSEIFFSLFRHNIPDLFKTCQTAKMALRRRKDRANVLKHIKLISESLKADDDEHISHLDDFLNLFPPSTSHENIASYADAFRKWEILELVLDKVLPATFATTFLSIIHLLVQLGKYRASVIHSHIYQCE